MRLSDHIQPDVPDSATPAYSLSRIRNYRCCLPHGDRSSRRHRNNTESIENEVLAESVLLNLITPLSAFRKSSMPVRGTMMVLRRPLTSSIIRRKRPREFSRRSNVTCFRSIIMLQFHSRVSPPDEPPHDGFATVGNPDLPSSGYSFIMRPTGNSGSTQALNFHPFDSVLEQLGTTLYIQFLFDSRSVAFHRADAQAQQFGDLPCPQPLSEQSENLQLTVTQPLQR